jgi:hypothetical protein
VADAVERVRGGVISTGIATISNEGGFSMADSFGRSGTNDVTAGTLWSTTSADGLREPDDVDRHLPGRER